MDDSSVFGAKPDKLDRLLHFGLEEAKVDGEVAPTGSFDTIMERPGGRIDNYKLLRILGEGGMGIVYLAQQEEPVRREVALKVIKPGMDSKRVIARFETEKQALAIMHHPHIARVYDAGITLTGRSYFVMEYVKGMPITDFCDHHKLTIKDRLGLFSQVCQAFQHAHQKGIIHRDIKPSNILVSVENDQPIPKIIDFGVAKATGRPLTEMTLQTEERQLLGTPEYMSPEQADMANEDIDTRSDIYSLGVLLYVLLTGALPFEPETLREGGIDQIRRTIREIDPKTPSTRLMNLGEEGTKVAEMRRTEIRLLEKNLKKELEWIPLKAMRKERSERYRSASELADDIENYLNGIPLIAGPPTTLYRLRKLVRRNALASTAVLSVAVTLILGLIATTAMYIRAEKARENEARARIESQAIADFLREDVLSTVSDANAHEQTLSYVLDKASGNLEGKFDDHPIVEASIRNTLGWTYKNIGKQAKAVEEFETALKIYEEHLGEGDLRAIHTMSALAYAYQQQKRWDDAISMMKRQSRIVQRENHSDYEIPLNALGCLYTNLGMYKEAEEALVKKLEITRRIQGSNAGYGWFTANLAKVYRYQGRYEEAEDLYKKTLEMAGWDPNHRMRLNFTLALAGVYRNQGRYAEAEELYRSVMERQTEVYGEGGTVGTMVGLARAYTDQGLCDEANELFAKIDEIRGISANRESQNLPYIDTLAVLRTKQERFPEAKDLFERALEIRKQKFNRWADDHPGTLKTKNDLAVLYKEQKLYDKAEPLLIEAVKGRRLKLGDEHPHTQESIKTLIGLYEVWGKPEQANEWRAELPES